MDFSDFGGEKILWEEDGFVVITDYYVGTGRRPTATLWHRCTPTMTHGIHKPSEDPTCYHCSAVAPKLVLGFYELIRYGQECG